ncbi:MAG TPA: anti-sigma factor [Candidatus Angelobacter sp.]|nr:anti-sigma factor [Candidatus Angelobacter sp.]
MKDHAQFAEDLALYAMGSLDDQASHELQTHLGTCAECRRELEALRGDLALLALSATGPQPPQRSRQRLKEAISEEQRQMSGSEGAPALRRLRPRWLTLAPAAVAVLLAVTSLGLLLEVQRLKDSNTKLFVELRKTKQDAAYAKEILVMLTDPGAQRMTLVAAKTAPPAHINVIYQKDKGHILLLASNLAPIPDNKVYQLWLLPAGSAAPMPCGTFRIDGQGNSMMPDTMKAEGVEAKGFAVTVEPVGGSNTPTMPIVYAPAG